MKLLLKYSIGLKHFFDINLGIGIIKRTTFFVCIFDISPHVFTQISIRGARWMRFFQVFLFFGVDGSAKVCQVGTRWMHNLIPHPTSSPDQNLIKNMGRYVKNTNKKSSFFMIPIPKFILNTFLI